MPATLTVTDSDAEYRSAKLKANKDVMKFTHKRLATFSRRTEISARLTVELVRLLTAVR